MRETKTFETSRGNKIEHYTYISGGENNIVQDIITSSATVTLGDDNKPVVQGFDPTGSLKAKRKLVELLVVSVNGVKENAYQKVLDLPVKEYEEVVSVIDKVDAGMDEEKKTNLATK